MHDDQYIKILRVRLSVRPSVRSGNGRVFSLKLFILGLQRAARYVRHATVGACRRTSNRQEHKITQRAGPEQDTIFHLHVTACRRRGSHRQDQRLAWIASRGQGTSCSSSFVSKVLGANYKTANNFLPVAHKFTMCTDRKQPLNLPADWAWQREPPPLLHGVRRRARTRQTQQQASTPEWSHLTGHN